jgi:hypothetical protein
MPNRIIKDAILVSANIDQLTADEERFFFRLLLVSDDYGRFDARPPVIRGRAYPLKPEVTDQHVLSWIAKLVEVDILHAYQINGARFVGFSNWHTYQNVRAGKSKYPSPEGAQLLHAEDVVGNSTPLLAPAIICKQTQADDSSSRISSLASRLSPLVSRVSPLVSSPEPSSADADAGGDLGPSPLLLAETTQTQPTTQPAAAPVRPTPTVDVTGQASLIPATGKPDRRRKPAGEPDDEPTATADLDRWVARYVELKKPPFPPALTKEDRIFFCQQRKARGIDELVWVLETLHGDAWSAHSTIRQLLSAEAAQKAAGITARVAAKPLVMNHAEQTLSVARAMVGADRDFMPPEDYR